ncbi:MAG: PKD domain-containing protein, partial [Bacteroidales bacterium]|nr:PKD domain-containing protein [Bacteroidales bacterium]
SYASLYYGSVARYYNNNYEMVVCEDGAYGINESGAWITPYILDEYNANIMFIGYKNIWRCNNVKAGQGQISWKKISDFSNGENMAVVEQSPANTEILYAGKYGGAVYRTDQAGSSNPQWIELTSFLPAGGTAGDIEAHPFDENIVYIALGDNIYKSDDKGLTWENITLNLPAVNKTSIAYYKNSREGLYVASDLGVFYKEEGMTEWVWFNQGLPVDASVREIEIYYDAYDVSEDAIRAGTYGRGLWSSDMWEGQPVAAFSSTETTIPPNCQVDFFNESTGGPQNFEWTFEGAAPATSSDMNPTGISYATAGTYYVALKVWNSLGQDSTYVEGYITVSEDVLPEVDFMADELSPCGSSSVQFTDLTLYCPTSWQWEFSPDDVTFMGGTGANSQHPLVQFNSAGMYTVTLTAENANGQGSLTREDYIAIGGMGLPFTEDFENGSFSDKGWTIHNPDMGITWDITEVEGSSPGNKAAWINLFDYNSLGARDMLISPAMNFDGFSTLALTFDHAYSSKYPFIDTLIVKISTDCGETWNRLFSAAYEELETAPASTTSFFPQSADDWCGSGTGTSCYLIDLSDYASLIGVKIAFETFGFRGNNLFIDNIEISNSVGLSDAQYAEAEVLIYPNPSEGIFNIVLPDRKESIRMSIRNLNGQEVWKEDIGSGRKQSIFDASDMPKGIYFISFVSNEMNITRKIVVR